MSTSKNRSHFLLNGMKRLFSVSYSGVIIITLVLSTILAFITPGHTFFTAPNILNIFKQVAVYGMIAVGMSFVMISGGIDLSVGATAGFAGCVTSLLVTMEVMPLVPSIIIGVASGIVIGLICGLIVAFTGIPPFVATLSVQISVRGLAYIIANGKPVGGLPQAYLNLGVGDIAGVPIPILFMLALFVLGAIVLRRTTYGRSVYAVGGNKEAAHLAGVNVKRITMLVYVISGAAAALAGIILAARNISAQPNAGTAFETEAIAGCAMGGVAFTGGTGTMTGVLFGIMLMGVINNGMNLLGISSYWQLVVKGIIMVSAVIYSMRKRKN